MSSMPQPTKGLSERAKQRLDRKKKKLKAFLEVAKANDEDRKREVVKRKTGKHSLLDEDCSKKQLKNEADKEAGQSSTSYGPQHNAHLSSDKTDPLVQENCSEDLAQLRAEIKARQKASMQMPKIFLTLDELKNDQGQQDNVADTKQPILYLMDLQHLLLFALQGNLASYRPRWCRLLRVGKVSGVSMVVINSLSYQDYKSHQEWFPNINELFTMNVEMISPYQYGMSPAEELFWVPLSHEKIKALVKTLPHVKSQLPKLESIGKDVFPRRNLLLNPEQMILEGFPLPIAEKNQSFVFTCNNYSEVTDASPLFAIDCEMCMTVTGKLELTRISLVNEKVEVIYDTYVKPYNKITDYLTQYSGITENILRPINTRLSDVQETLCSILPSDAILCGQSLNADLLALKMFHPYVIDTSVIYNMTGQRRMKTSLKVLTARFLGRAIQDGKDGHSSVEDATATLELVKLKLSKGQDFGDAIMGPISCTIQEATAGEDTAEDANLPATKKFKLSENASGTNTLQASTCNIIENKVTDTFEKNMACASKDMVCTDNMERKRTFFQRSTAWMYESFSKVLEDAKKKGIIIDDQSFASNAVNMEKRGSVLICDSKNDKSTKKMFQEKVQTHNFVWSQLHSFVANAKNEDKKNICKKIDKRIKKMHNAVPDNSVFIVVFTGRNSEDVQSAACFVKCMRDSL